MDNDTPDQLADTARRIAARELATLDSKSEQFGLSDEDVDRLGKLALVIQRVRQPADRAPLVPLTGEQLMRKAGLDG